MKWRRASLTAAMVAVALLIESCGASGTTYVTSASTHTFLKVPGSWTVFKQDQIRARPEVAGLPALPFFVAFDADPRPSLDHSYRSGRFPWGLVRVRDLGAAEQDSFSLASIRNEVFPVDSTLQSSANAVQLLAPPKEWTHQGLRGSKLEYAVHLAGKNFTVTQAAFVDAATHRVWAMIVGCESTCFQRNAAAIHRVADSWIVEGR